MQVQESKTFYFLACLYEQLAVRAVSSMETKCPCQDTGYCWEGGTLELRDKLEQTRSKIWVQTSIDPYVLEIINKNYCLVFEIISRLRVADQSLSLLVPTPSISQQTLETSPFCAS
jgi:hypothetical protein